MNEKENQKMDELSQKLEAIDQQEALTHPMTGTRRWFFRALTFGIGGAILGTSFIAGAKSNCTAGNKTCGNNTCYSEENTCYTKNYCEVTNTCYTKNYCVEVNSCFYNECKKNNTCYLINSCDYTNTCSEINRTE